MCIEKTIPASRQYLYSLKPLQSLQRRFIFQIVIARNPNLLG